VTWPALVETTLPRMAKLFCGAEALAAGGGEEWQPASKVIHNREIWIENDLRGTGRLLLP
jgi:hypothetical protein